MNRTIGTCSLCGGAVTAPEMWASVLPYVPTCSSCGATAAAHGPVIPMVQPARVPSVFGAPSTSPDWWYTAVPADGTAVDPAGTITIMLPPTLTASTYTGES